MQHQTGYIHSKIDRSLKDHAELKVKKQIQVYNMVSFITYIHKTIIHFYNNL